MTEDSSSTLDRCDFCRQPRPADDVTLEYEGSTYDFCTETCRDAMIDSERVFTEYHGHRRFRTGVTGIDDSLPEGLPRNSLVLFPGQSGTREEAIEAELAWRALERDEPAVVVAFTEPPTSVVENFLAMDWNVLPHLEAGDLRILDCFTPRLDDSDRRRDRMTAWNRHLHRITEPQTVVVRDPTDGHELRNKLDNCLEALEMVETGVVIVDSLAEFGSLVPPVQAYDFVRDVRADVCKGRFVPVFAGATVAGEDHTFPRDLDYVVDGVIDLVLDGSIVEDTLFRRLRVRKMRGVLTISEWHTYEYTAGLGLVTFDPRDEIDRREPDEAGGDAAAGEGAEGDGTDADAEAGADADADGARDDASIDDRPDGEPAALDGDETGREESGTEDEDDA